MSCLGASRRDCSVYTQKYQHILISTQQYLHITYVMDRNTAVIMRMRGTAKEVSGILSSS